MLFLLLFISFFNFSQTEVKWENITGEIALNENYMEVLLDAKASLIINGNKMADPEIIYRYDGVERTFLSTINTSIVKTYHHKIEAYFPEYDIKSITTITIKVIDNVAPSFLYIPEIVLIYGEKIPNLLIGIHIYDNYDLENDLKVSVDQRFVNTNQIGIYPVHFSVEDLSGNRTTKTVYATVIDINKPSITIIKALNHPVNKAFKWKDYIQITDKEDQHLEIVYDYNFPNPLTIGTHPFTIRATDSSGNSQTLSGEMVIYDDIAPTIKLNSKIENIAYGDKDYFKKLREMIIFAEDNYDQLNIEDVAIYTNLNPNQLGSYAVIYVLKDASNNETKIQVEVKVTDQEAPRICLREPLTFFVGSNKPLIESYINVTDNLTTDKNIQFHITGNIDMQKIGSYVITVKATDESGNVTTEAMIVEVIDHIPPAIVKLKDIYITTFEKPVYAGYYDIQDNYDPKPHLVIDDSLVNYLKTGVYPIIVKAIDQSSNESVVNDEVIVIDVTPPTIKLKTDQIDIFFGTETINYRLYIDDFFDNYDDITIEDIIITSDYKKDEFGLYQAIYQVEDYAHNKTEVILWIRVIDLEPPIIEFEDVMVNQYEDVDLMNGVFIFDNTSKVDVKVYPHRLETNQAGKVVVTYIATDQRGNVTKMNRTYTIVAVSDHKSIKSYIPMIVMSLVGGGISTLLYIKYKKHML